MLLHKPRSLHAGYSLRGHHLESLFAFKDVFWMGETVCVVKGNSPHPIERVTLVWQLEGDDGKMVQRDLERLAETPELLLYHVPQEARDGAGYFASVALLASDGTLWIEDNVENLEITWPIIRPSKETQVSVALLDRDSVSVHFSGKKGAAGPDHLHFAFIQGSVDAADLMEMVQRPGFVPDDLAEDQNAMLFLIEWRARVGNLDELQKYAETVTLLLEQTHKLDPSQVQ